MANTPTVEMLEPPAPPRALGTRLRFTPAATLARLGPLIALILACAFFAAKSDRFLTGSNFSLIVQQSMVVGVLAIGQTLIILTAGIDLSCGAVMALGAIVMTREAVVHGVNPWLAILLGIGVGVGFGIINGVLISFFGLPSFIVTLGTLNIAFAITHIYSHDEKVAGLPDIQTWLGNTFRLGQTAVTYGTVVMLGLYALTWYVLHQTSAGRHIFALGNNPEAARLTGINVRRLLLIVYTAAGLFYGIAALLQIARVEVGDPNAGQTENLSSITAVVIGGTSLFGGKGTILGTLIGVLIVGVFRNGLQLIGVASIYQVLVTGVLVILAVTVDQLARRRRG
jgi:fructose transport system permease protein